MKTIGVVITGVVCMAAGFAVGMHITKKRYEQVINKEIDESVSYFKEKYETLRAETKAYPNDKPEDSVTVEKRPENDSDSKVAVKTTIDNLKRKEQDEYTDYTAKYTKNTKFKMDDISPSDDVPAQTEEYKLMEEPWIIDEERWEQTADEAPEYEEYESVDWSYFEVDSVFTDDWGNVVPNGMEQVGEENLDKFNSKDKLYVRNDQYKKNYKITLVREAYYDRFD